MEHLNSNNYSLKLVGSLTSPYVRKLRLFIFDKPECEFRAINYFIPDDAQYLKSISPINKIPVLILQDRQGQEKVLYESRVIYNLLSHKFKTKTFSIEEENILSAIDSCLEAGVNLFLLRKSGIDIDNKDLWYAARQKERFQDIYKFLTPWASTLHPQKDWNYLSMSLYSLLDWANFREVAKDVADFQNWPELLAFKDRFKNSAGILGRVLI